MAIISIIAALDDNKAIGKNGDLLCHLPNDLKYFKSITQGHTVIMGRKTFESLPNGALPHRRNIVVSNKPGLEIENCEVYDSLEKAFAACESEYEAFVIGGGSIYMQSIGEADKLYITVIHHQFEGADTYFPDIEEKNWQLISEKYNAADEKNKYAHTFRIYKRLS